jgi:large subunit ribosomal protein L33
MSQENLIRLRCDVCKTANYHSTRNKKKLKEKLELKKYCRKCRKHTLHKEAKVKGK